MRPRPPSISGRILDIAVSRIGKLGTPGIDALDVHATACPPGEELSKVVEDARTGERDKLRVHRHRYRSNALRKSHLFNRILIMRCFQRIRGWTHLVRDA